MVSLEQLQELDPYDFEKAIASLWEAKGFETNLRQQSGDRGVDIEAEKVGAGWKEVIQAKRYTGKNKVGSQQIREYATLYQQVPDANAVVVVTSGEFTDEAESLADDLRVETYDGRELVREISDTGVDLNLAPEENGSQSDTLQLGSSDPEIDSYGSVELGGGTIVEPQDYFRDHLKKRSGSAGLKSQPWVYVATEVDGLDL
ncbi:restriction endonuclease [Halobacterium sp. KA-6]|uniref:restriction endonuclease n=1 Tax=Halobacterium sp. KA-6 TaxID=2896368 RepID=UPI001E59614E|nr:restriction endonuclease [Halobacterium sp. KA-6]MCD2203640.1 restriction endonuclease [Halobacterium sp. KA-6]